MPHTIALPLRAITLVGLFCLTPALVAATELVRPKPLMEYADILLAQELDVAVSALNTRVSHCVESGAGNGGDCLCRYRSEADTAKAAYEKTLAARPKWQGKILYWKNPESLASRQLIMPALGQQLQSSMPMCSTHTPVKAER
jgi:hypothetical protein